ncbi:MAG TPA: PKD domain-containing protein [Candidatus Angelobacter sp.]
MAFALLATAPAFPQDGQPPPKQEPPRTGGQGSGTSTGVGIDVGEVIGLFHKHAKVHLDAAPQQAQVGDFIAFSTKVSPKAAGLTYEYHWSQDKSASGDPEQVASINHAYTAPGEYKAWVIVYQNGKKVATSNEVKINVKPSVATITPPPPDRVPQPPKIEPAPVTVQTEPTKATITSGEPKPTVVPPVPTPTAKANPPTPVETQTATAPPGKPSSQQPKIAATESATTATPPIDISPPRLTPQKTEYSLLLYFNPHPETGKPVDFRAELKPEAPAGTHVKYCFYWGDGEPPSCQNASTAVHEYHSKGRYLAAVEAYANEEEVASRGQKLATSGPVQIEAVSSSWSATLPYLAGVLVVLAAAYGTHRIRKMLRFKVTANPGVGRHTIAPDVRHDGEVLRIRCVRSGARSQIIFATPEQTTKGAAHVG